MTLKLVQPDTDLTVIDGGTTAFARCCAQLDRWNSQQIAQVFAGTCTSEYEIAMATRVHCLRTSGYGCSPTLNDAYLQMWRCISRITPLRAATDRAGDRFISLFPGSASVTVIDLAECLRLSFNAVPSLATAAVSIGIAVVDCHDDGILTDTMTALACSTLRGGSICLGVGGRFYYCD